MRVEWEQMLSSAATAKRMTELHGPDKAFEWAISHACSYPSWSWWVDVAANILRIQKETKQ